jgi:hypothetical protein
MYCPMPIPGAGPRGGVSDNAVRRRHGPCQVRPICDGANTDVAIDLTETNFTSARDHLLLQGADGTFRGPRLVPMGDLLQ